MAKPAPKSKQVKESSASILAPAAASAGDDREARRAAKLARRAEKEARRLAKAEAKAARKAARQAEKQAKKQAKQEALAADRQSRTAQQTKDREEAAGAAPQVPPEGKTLCELRKKFLKKHMASYLALVDAPRFVCRKCGRVANDEARLCKPLPLSR